jgi:glutaminase
VSTLSLSHIQEIIQDVYVKYKDINEGKVATYIPELAKANPDHFGIAMATVDGLVWSVGDAHQEFTIQSICAASSTREWNTVCTSTFRNARCW